MEPISAFYLFLAAGIVSALYAPIQDCDETYNYWEPAHYLVHGYGRQTWEYAPTYAIRSWLYVGVHAAAAAVRRLLPQPSKTGEFYFVRCVVAAACALCQTVLFRVVSGAVHPRIAFFFLVALCTSPGNFHASSAFLPSSFAMCAAMLGTAAFLDWRRAGPQTVRGLVWFAVAAVLGWPFAGALCLPFVAEEAVLAVAGGGPGIYEGVLCALRGLVAALLLVVLDTAVNLFFYHRVEVVPWNIVRYNVVAAAEGRGPDLYGTEPWTFYLRNLLLNFHVWFVLALLALPLFVLHKLVSGARGRGSGSTTTAAATSRLSGMRVIVFLTPFYLWLAIFSLQPHKEERFMYPAYPFLALNAAIALHMVLEALGRPAPGSLLGLVPARARLAAVVAVFAAALAVSALRIYGVVSAYGAPLAVYRPLGGHLVPADHAAAEREGRVVGAPGDSVCFGKDWYRFPSSFFLPRDMHAKFVRSAFRGLLPGEFAEAGVGFGIWGGTWLSPPGMNDRNEEDMGKYVGLDECTFLVDTQYPEADADADADAALPPDEPDYVADTAHWDVVVCEPFLDAARTGFLARTLWVPPLDIVPDRFRRKWARHCLLRRRKDAPPVVA